MRKNKLLLFVSLLATFLGVSGVILWSHQSPNEDTPSQKTASTAPTEDPPPNLVLLQQIQQNLSNNGVEANNKVEEFDEQKVIERLNTNQVSDSERQYWIKTFARLTEQETQRISERIKELSDQVDAYEKQHAGIIRRLNNKFSNLN